MSFILKNILCIIYYIQNVDANTKNVLDVVYLTVKCCQFSSNDLSFLNAMKADTNHLL